MPRQTRGTIPVYSTDGLLVRRVSVTQAQALVDGGEADAITVGKWRKRTDVPWQGIKLKHYRSDRNSPCCLTETEMEVNAGAYSDLHSPDYVEAVREKVRIWPTVGDTKAPRVGIRVR